MEQRLDTNRRVTGLRLDGKVALITGAGSGIGRAVLDQFVAEGAKVAVLERDSDRCSQIATDYPSSVLVHHGDAVSADDNEALVRSALEEFGGLDCVVTNVGTYDFGRSLEHIGGQLTAAFADLFATNVLSCLQTVAASADALRASGGAVVVTLSSSALYPGGGGVLYVASKHALVGVVRQLAYEFAPVVRVNGVAPGYTRTDLRGIETFGEKTRTLSEQSGFECAVAERLPLGFVAEPSDHANLYVTLACDESRFMTGVVVPSDGGVGVGRRSEAGRS